MTTLTQRADPSASPPWPLAVGVLLTADYPSEERAERRLELALGAYRLGYYLLDLVEVDARTPADAVTRSRASVWDPVAALAARARPDALVVHVAHTCDGVGALPDLPPVLAALPIRLVQP
jgi:hypothetical protein